MILTKEQLEAFRVEELAAQLHEVYMKEAKRQGDEWVQQDAKAALDALIVTKVEEHNKHVKRWLTEMYQTMIDLVEEFNSNIEKLCEALLRRAREDREAAN